MPKYLIEALDAQDAQECLAEGSLIIHTVHRADGRIEGFTPAEQLRAQAAYNGSDAARRVFPNEPRAVMTWHGDVLLQVGPVYLNEQGEQIHLPDLDRQDLAGAAMPPWAESVLAAYDASERALYAEQQALLQ